MITHAINGEDCLPVFISELITAKENGSTETSHIQTARFGCHELVAVINLFNFLYSTFRSQNFYRS